MAEWFLPFAPPQQPAEEAVTREPVPIHREWDPNQFLLCTFCKDPIEHGDEAMELSPGISGFGEKSGKPTLLSVDDPIHQRAVLHYYCITPYILHPELTDGEGDYFEDSYEEEPQFCAGCEAKLSGEDG